MFIICFEFSKEPFQLNGSFEYPQSKIGGRDQDIDTITYHIFSMIPHGKVTKTQLNFTDESQEVSPFPAGGYKAAMNRGGGGLKPVSQRQPHP